MFLFKMIGSLIGLVAGFLAGDRVGSQMQAYLTGEAPRDSRFVRTNEAGETVIAVGFLRARLVPAILLGLLGKPRWLFAFLGGLLSSGLLETFRKDKSGAP